MVRYAQLTHPTYLNIFNSVGCVRRKSLRSTIPFDYDQDGALRTLRIMREVAQPDIIVLQFAFRVRLQIHLNIDLP